ncbi:ATP-binding cassette sub- A member 5, partial [Blyttiomyces sp. JEL0837]
QKHIGVNETKLLKDRVFVGRNQNQKDQQQQQQQQQHNVVEITFDISTRSANKFPGLFEELDMMKKWGRKGLEYYGLSTPTLEEVFLKSEDFGGVVGAEGDIGEEERIAVGEEDWEAIMDVPKLSPFMLWLTQMKVLSQTRLLLQSKVLFAYLLSLLSASYFVWICIDGISANTSGVVVDSGTLGPNYFMFALGINSLVVHFVRDNAVERSSRVFSLMRVMGVDPVLVYWMSSFVTHWILMAPVVGLVVGLAWRLKVWLLVGLEGGALDVFSTLFEKPEYFSGTASLIMVLVMPLGFLGLFTIYLTNVKIFQFYHVVASIFLPTYPLPSMLFFMTDMYVKARSKLIPPLTFWSYFKWGNHMLPPFLACFVHILVAAGLLSLPEVNLKSVQGWAHSLVTRFGFWRGEDRDNDLRRPLLELDETVDEDVRVEAERALNLSGDGDGGIAGEGLICVQKLSKTFKVKRHQPAKTLFGALFGKSHVEKTAVTNISFAVDLGDVFVLLGPNGAGKSTLMRIVIGEILPDVGSVSLGSQGVEKDGGDEENLRLASGGTGISASELSPSSRSLSGALSGRIGNMAKVVGTFNGGGAVSAGSNVKVGYTPQEDALWPKLTIEEHLMLYTRLRGVDSKAGMERVRRLVKALDLEEHVKKNVEALSGGTKRKTSFLISLCGGVHVLFLDEPSAGLDPKAKRTQWNLVNHHRNRMATLLTTHSMDEAEALGSRIAIMVNGQFVCLGSPQHLKAKFGHTYLLEVHTESQGAIIAREWVSQHFPHAEMKESLEGVMSRWEVPVQDVEDVGGLGKAFKLIEGFKQRHRRILKEYSLGQTTLEMIFVKFAREQEARQKTLTFKDMLARIYRLLLQLAAILITVTFLSCKAETTTTFSQSTTTATTPPLIIGYRVGDPNDPSFAYRMNQVVNYRLKQIQANASLHPSVRMAQLHIVPLTAWDEGHAFTDALEVVRSGAVAAIGSTFSSITMPYASLLNAFKMPVCDGSATNPLLSDMTVYPNFFRTLPQDNYQGAAVAAFIHNQGWTEFTLLYSMSTYGQGIAKAAIAAASRYNLSVAGQYGFFSNSGTYLDYLDNIKDSLSTIIVMVCDSVTDARTILRQAGKTGIIGAGYAWITTDTFQSYDFSVSSAEDLNVVNGVINIYPLEGQGPLYDAFLKEWQSLDPAMCVQYLLFALQKLQKHLRL